MCSMRVVSARLKKAGAKPNKSTSASQARQKAPGALHIRPILVAEPLQQHCFLSLHPRSKQNAHRQQHEADEPVRGQKEEGKRPGKIGRVYRVPDPSVRTGRHQRVGIFDHDGPRIRVPQDQREDGPAAEDIGGKRDGDARPAQPRGEG